MDYPNDSEDDWEVDYESDIELDNSIDDWGITEQLHVSAAHDVAGLIWPAPRSNQIAETRLMMVNAMESRRNKGNKNPEDRMHHHIFTRFIVLHDRELCLEKYY